MGAGRASARPVPFFLPAWISPPLRDPKPSGFAPVAAPMRSHECGSGLLRVATPCSSLGHPCGMTSYGLKYLVGRKR